MKKTKLRTKKIVRTLCRQTLRVLTTSIQLLIHIKRAIATIILYQFKDVLSDFIRNDLYPLIEILLDWIKKD